MATKPEEKALPLGHLFVTWPGSGERDRCYHKKTLVGWDEWSICAQPRAAHEASVPDTTTHERPPMRTWQPPSPSEPSDAWIEEAAYQIHRHQPMSIYAISDFIRKHHAACRRER